MKRTPRNVDLRVYALLDPQVTPRDEIPRLCERLIAGGATLLQVRDKLGASREQVALACSVIEAARGRVPVLINDRVDVALAAGADGVHLGQDDMDPQSARQLLGDHAIIGLTVKSVQQAQAAPPDLIDYICIGGVFATGSKDNPDPPIGLVGLRTVVASFRACAGDMPAGAIAGIDASNAADVIAAGADGVAVISALAHADDPEAATCALRKIVDDALVLQRSR